MRSPTISASRGWGPSGAVTRSRIPGWWADALGGELRNVPLPMTSGPQEVGGDDHRGGAGGHTSGECGGNGGLGQLHVGRFDGSVPTPIRPAADELLVSPVRFVAAGPVVDHHDSQGAVYRPAVVMVGTVHAPRLTGATGPPPESLSVR